MRSYFSRSPIIWVLGGIVLALLYSLVSYGVTPFGKHGHLRVIESLEGATLSERTEGVASVPFQRPEGTIEPLPKLRLKRKHLRAFRGQTPKTPIYIAIRGVIYDASTARAFYGPGGAYAIFAGTDATLGLTKGRLDLAGEAAKIEDFSKRDLESLEEWEGKFKAKYNVVGILEDE